MVLIVRRMAPILAVANISVTQSGTFVAQTATLSPFSTPMAMSPFATWSTATPHSFQESLRSLST